MSARMGINNADRIRIVLLNTSHPGNIGAAARAMKTMCLHRLYLVQPGQFPCAEATARASGADDLLAKAVVCASMEEALQGCHLVAGLSARRRSVGWPSVNPRQCMERIFEQPDQEVALVFGNEQSGMSNEELGRCNLLVHIPANPDYSSLNLGAAVQVMAHEFRMAIEVQEPQLPVLASDAPAASADQLERMYTHLEETLVRLEFLDPTNPRLLMHRIRRLYNRASLDEREVQILRGILSATNQKLDQLRSK